jgi:hypothetical protein
MRSGKSLLALLVVFGGLVAYLYYVDAKKPVTPEGSEQKDKVFTIDAAKIDELTVKSSSGERSLVRKSKDGWQLSAPTAARADESEVSGITSNLASLEVSSVVDEQPKNLDQYGLKHPRVEIAFKAQGDKNVRTLRLGGKTPTGGDMYAQRGGERRVLLVPAYVDATFDRKPFDLREKTVLKFDRDKVDHLEVTANDSTVGFTKNGLDWAIVAPVKARADFSAVEGIVTRLQSAHMTALESADAADLRQYGLDKPSASAVVGTGSSRATLLIGSTAEGKDGVFAKDASRPMVFIIGKDVADELKKGVNDFRRKDLFEFRPFNARRVEITRGAEALVLEKMKGTGKDATEKWRRVSPTAGDVDQTKTETLLSKFSNLRAQSFVEPHTPTGLTSPVVTVHARFDETNKEERVTFGKVGSDVFAGRPDEPGAARVDASEFDQAVKALDALK